SPALSSLLFTSVAFHLRLLFSSMLRPPPPSTLFPYTTLFRSLLHSQLLHFRLNQMYGSLFLLLFLRHSYTVYPLCIIPRGYTVRSEEHTSELQSRFDLVCRLLLEKKKDITTECTCTLLRGV